MTTQTNEVVDQNAKTVRIFVPGGTAVLDVFDVGGRRVRRLLDATEVSGVREFSLMVDGRLAPGIYFARLTIGSVVRQRRFTIIR